MIDIILSAIIVVMDNKILNPKTGRYVSKTGKIGQELLKQLKEINVHKKCSDQKIKECKINNKICNEKSGRCIKNKEEPKKQQEPEKQKVSKKQEVHKKQEETIKQESSHKKININKLKEEWKLIYTNSNCLSLDIINHGNNFLDIKISKTQKIIGVNGIGTIILRKMKDLALANRENIDVYLPKNFTGKYYANPLWNRVHGYMYYLNDHNVKNL